MYGILAGNSDNETNMPTKKTYFQMTAAFMFLSFLAQLAGFAIPSWLHLNRPEHSVSQKYALWYAILCFEDTCRTKTYAALQHDRNIYSYEDFGFHDDENFEEYEFNAKFSKFPFSRIVEFEAEATVALVMAFLGYSAANKHKKDYIRYLEGKRSRQPKPRYCLCLLSALASGILILIPCTKFLDINKTLQYLAAEDEFKVGIPYALIASGIGGILALTSCLSAIAVMWKSVNSSENRCSDDSEYNNEEASSRPPVVPLLPLDTQTTSAGYTEPVMPGYVSVYNNYQSQGRSVSPNIHEASENERHRGDFDNDRFRGAINVDHQLQDNQDTRSTDQHYDQPPPSYDEVMSKHPLYNPP